MTPEKSIGEIVNSCGFAWDENDPAQQRRALEGVARCVHYWREKHDDAIRGTVRESLYQHLQRRLIAITKKCRNVRKAAIEYKGARDFDKAVVKLCLEYEEDPVTGDVRIVQR